MKFWDTRSGNTPTAEIKLAGKVTSLDVSKSGCYVLACARNNAVYLHDVRMAKTSVPVSSFVADGFQVSF